ncbi:MAG: carbon monoxide dehydrogenase [Nitriliruptor sp.]|nr:MAG: carbon monoxide dehydrogenase [Nitriliruptor sp.]
MEFVNEFTVPTDIDTTWRTLIDLEKVAPCLPGATLEEVDGDVYTGRVKVKVGPITVSYRGTAELIDVDEEAKTARIDAKGKETRGAGTANADVSAKLTETDEGTLVHVVTDLTVTGKPAQFGRGVMGEVGTKIIDQFSERLEELVLSDGGAAGGEAVASGAAAVGAEASAEGAVSPAEPGVAAPAATGPRKIAPDPSRENEALDLMEVAGAATIKRAVPLVAGLALVAGLIWWLTRR